MIGPDDPKLELFAEEVSVEKETIETGRVRVSKRTRTREVIVGETLFREVVEVETIPIGSQIFAAPPVRREVVQDGETTIIPIVEEVLHVERRLVLKEEMRITRRRVSKPFTDNVTLRYQEAIVTREPPAADEPRGPPP